MYSRLQKLPLSAEETCFLWGPRQTGKSTLLKALFPEATRYDLLLSDTYQRLLRRPELLREECVAAGLDSRSQKSPVIIDEIQKLPVLLDEVHWLIENRDSGSFCVDLVPGRSGEDTRISLGGVLFAVSFIHSYSRRRRISR
jgi:predicted AAA+ superfamily ATPase